MNRLILSMASCHFALSSLTFNVIGDWGGAPTAPFTTIGEVDSARSMGAVALTLNSSFTLALGDNFYDDGVKNVDDPRFQTTFENVWTAQSLFRPWYFVCGNHDHYGNCSAQIEYTNKSNRWTFPDYYYLLSKTAPDGSSIDIVMIDTVLLAGLGDDETPGSALPGPADAVRADVQLQWIEATLAASKADYIIVAGHYPVWSVAEHGPTNLLVSDLMPLLQKYSVSAYLSGHDHNSQHIADPKDTTAIDYHVIGHTHLCDQSTAHSKYIPADSLKWHWANGTGGFGTVTISQSGLVISHYDQSGNVIYTAPTKSPRK